MIFGTYHENRSFSEGLAAVKSDAGWGFIEINGNEILPLTDNYLGFKSPVYDMIPFTKDNHKYGVYEIK